jgi:hypothetical protein
MAAIGYNYSVDFAKREWIREKVMKKIIATIAAVLMAVGCVAHAGGTGNWDIYNNAVIQEGDVYWTVRTFDTPPEHTTVDMTGGRAYGIHTYDASTLNFSGGLTEVTAYEESIVNVSGGTIYTIASWGSSTVNVYGGSVYVLYVWETSTANILEGADVDGGAGVRGAATINMTGGTVDRIGAIESGMVNLSGGLVLDSLGAEDSGIINIYGYDLDKVASGGKYGYGFVSGYWAGSTPFNIDLNGSETYSRVVLIPEPSTILLTFTGVLLFRNCRKSWKGKAI